MSKTLTWPQWLNVIAQNTAENHPYICCHIDGSYLEGLYIKNPSETYIDAVKSSNYEGFRTKLETKIKEELDALNLNLGPSKHTSTLSRKLGYPSEDGVKGRQDWLRSLKNI